MRTETRVFTVLAVFLYLVGAVYAGWTGATGGVERVGTVALTLSATLAAMCAAYFWLVSRRIPPRPEDRPDASPADGAGVVGFFSPASYWPPAVALASFLTALGIVVWQLWLVAAGLVGVVAGVAGLLYEYYTGSRRGAEL
jgi:hypothetical protein